MCGYLCKNFIEKYFRFINLNHSLRICPEDKRLDYKKKYLLRDKSYHIKNILRSKKIVVKWLAACFCLR